uniref:Uncharacterized protein n=1 Tax=Guillardia theta TaxID=55529 RepID=A0A7S4LZX7_GUITH|mmetsp:Transcript_11769/g.40634  ORF Transcript_11769/g.40634 Transcript_11769/m.40634 type:complete len:223 (+) Transcript_11769:276-944(+)
MQQNLHEIEHQTMVTAVVQPQEVGDCSNSLLSSSSGWSSKTSTGIKKKKMVFDTPRLLEESQLEDPQSLRSRILRSREPHDWSSLIEKRGMKKDPITTGHESVISEKIFEGRPPRNQDEDFLHEASLLYDAINRCNGVVTEKGAVDCLNQNGIHLKGIAKPSDKEMDLVDFTSLLRRGMRTHAGPANRTLALRRFRQTPAIEFDLLKCLSSFQDSIQEVILE